ncbi:hypothetical protein [Fodinicurvata sp. EGI_FJ10296]|uniref:esterase/lipase family protein n=1 Tax=Fodinicurvata sp. EGI_FJ10296 TaxID=3231908 RepID=UPI003456C8BE
MSRFLPIIYVRGYAGTQDFVESTVDLPYYGFNLGSTKVRTGPDGHPDFAIFESPLVRLMKDHGYSDVFARIDDDGEVEVLSNRAASTDGQTFPERTLWIYRYYDRTSRIIGSGTRDRVETIAEGLATLVAFVLASTGAPRVHLIAHSMGGLVCRSLIQRIYKAEAPKRVDRLFTYATPHRGIHFRSGLGALTEIRDLLGINESDTFGPRRLKELLGFPDDWAEDRLHEIGPHFSPTDVFSLIGTNHNDYGLARYAVGPGSDGLVQIDHAYVKGSSRAFIYRSHSGPLGIVNSEEGYQNLQRFLFGDTSVEIRLENLRLADRFRDDETLRYLMIETTVVIRGETTVMTDQREEHGSPLTVGAHDLETGGETLFRTFLMRSKRPPGDRRYSNFQIRVKILPHFVKDRMVLRDRHYFGERVFDRVLTVGIGDPDERGGWLIKSRWTSLDEEMPDRATRYPDPDDIRFPLSAAGLANGDLVLKIRMEET